MRKVILIAIAAIMALAGLTGPATATRTASIISDGLRVDVTFTGKQPTKAKLVVGGSTYKLTRKGKTWRTKTLTAQRIAALVGKQAKVKIKVKGKRRTVGATITRPATTPIAPPVPPTTPAPLFTAPGVDSTGNAAWEAIKGYFLDSTFTDCPAGWPNCAVEYRYGHFANYQQAYCRLTNTSGSDIINGRHPIYIAGAEQKADGSWAVSYQLDWGDGQPRWYSWYVAANGSVTGRYWFNADPNLSAPTEEITGLVWVRGARDCSY